MSVYLPRYTWPGVSVFLTRCVSGAFPPKGAGRSSLQRCGTWSRFHCQKRTWSGLSRMKRTYRWKGTIGPHLGVCQRTWLGVASSAPGAVSGPGPGGSALILPFSGAAHIVRLHHNYKHKSAHVNPTHTTSKQWTHCYTHLHWLVSCLQVCVSCVHVLCFCVYQLC